MNRQSRVDIVLVGGGHAHVHVLRAFAMRPESGVRLTLITRELETPYSAMLPGMVAGLYTAEQGHIDLARLCAATGTRLIHAEAVGLDRA
jgi:selenide, water dikinase